MKSKDDSRFKSIVMQLNNKVVHFIIKTVFISVLSLAALNFSPFGLSDVVDRYSQDLFTTWAAEFDYPELKHSGTGTLAREHYSVVLITENSLKWFPEGWPLSPDSYARILINLWAMKPRAIFIDIHWISMMSKVDVRYDASASLCSDHHMQPRSIDTSKLALVLSKLRESGVQLLTSVDSHEQWCRLPASIRKFLKPVSVMVDLDSGGFVARSYPLYQKANEPRLKSAALELCTLWKNDVEKQQQCIDSNIEQIDLVWGVQDNPDNYWMSSEGSTTGLEFLTQGLLKVRYKRPYATTIFIEDIINPLPESRDAKSNENSANKYASNHEEIVRLKEKIEDKIIFLGAKIDGVDDFILTPSRQIRPGVYYHAMAFDNLISFGRDVKSRAKAGLGEILKYAVVFLLSATTVGITMLPREHIGRSILEKNSTSFFRRIFALLLYIVIKYAFLPISIFLVTLAVYINSEILKLPPSFWIGYAGLVMLGVFFGSMDLFPIFKKYKDYLVKGRL